MPLLVSKLPPAGSEINYSQTLTDAVEIRMRSLVRECAVPVGSIEPIAHQAASYHLATGGQRIRAQLALQAGLALGLSVGDAVSIAATSELVHNASLVHDDLQDRDLTRRGADTVWVAYGEGVAICTGDLLLSAAYCALSGISRPHLLATLIPLLHRCISDASAGQCADLLPQKIRAFTLKDYEHLASLKSGALLAMPLELALVAGGELQAVPLARRAAQSFAIGYQIFDDLNDVQQDSTRATTQPAINVVALIEANTNSENAAALARQLAIKHLAMSAKSSQLLPRWSGQLLGQLALSLSARITAASA